jgi:hypothetical protein
MKDIQRLKAEAKKIYVQYKKRLSEFSCGGNLAEHIASDLCKNKERFNEIMEELEKADTNCPKGIRL